MKRTVVKVDKIQKTFRLPTESTQSLRTSLVNRFKGIKGYKEQSILRDISFDVEEGDFFGVVGKNGSGKSTLLKIISQIYVPEQGRVEIDGKLVSFIELGVGFNPELTGKENVYLNGAMLGFSSNEIDQMYDSIVDFAELHEFMNQKLKNYSSGMQVRLAFSVAIKADGDILILDEVLAVGDEAFQRKCNQYFMERKDSGKTTILVTHDMAAVKKYCNKAVLIEDGEVKVIGNPDDVANQYSLDNARRVNDQGTENDSTIQNLKVRLLSPEQLYTDDRIRFQIDYESKTDVDTYIAFSMTDMVRNIDIYNDNSFDHLSKGKGKHSLVYECQLNQLNGLYLKIQVSVRDKEHNMLAFSDSENRPVFLLKRRDQDQLSWSEADSTTGLLQRTGTWGK